MIRALSIFTWRTEAVAENAKYAAPCLPVELDFHRFTCGAVGRSNVQNLHIALLGDLTLSEHVANVPGDHRLIALK